MLNIRWYCKHKRKIFRFCFPSRTRLSLSTTPNTLRLLECPLDVWRQRGCQRQNMPVISAKAIEVIGLPSQSSVCCICAYRVAEHSTLFANAEFHVSGLTRFLRCLFGLFTFNKINIALNCCDPLSNIRAELEKNHWQNITLHCKCEREATQLKCTIRCSTTLLFFTRLISFIFLSFTVALLAWGRHWLSQNSKSKLRAFF